MPVSKLRPRLFALLAFCALLMVALIALTAARLQSMTDTLETVFQDRLLCQAYLRSVDDAHARQITGTLARWQAGEIDTQAAQAQITAAVARAAQAWQQYLNTYLVDDEKRLIAQAEPALRQADAAANELRGRLAGDKDAGLQAWADGPMRDRFAALSTAIEPLFMLQQTVAYAELQRARARHSRDISEMLLIMVSGCLMGGVAAWWLVMRFSAETQESARALDRMNAFYTARSRTNHLIVRATDDATLLRELCRACSATGHTGMSAVFLLEDGHATRFEALGSSANFFVEQPVRWSIHDPAYRLSPTAIALATGVQRVARLATLKAPAPDWRQRVNKHGIRSIASFPIWRAGQVYGALSLYATEPEFFDEDLVKLLSEMAGDVSFALDNLDREAARLRLQQQTQRDLERFQTLFRASPVACSISTVAEARVLEVNDVMCQRFGVNRAEVIGVARGLNGALMAEADAQVYRDALSRDGRVRNLEARVPLADGSEALVIVNAEIIDYMGEPCVMAMALDVTELRAAAVAEQARATAEAANRAKTAFLSHMSHELRTPLNAMLGFTQLMQRDARSRLLAQDIEQLEHIRRAGWHLLTLVNDVMDVSRIESGQFEVRLDVVALPVLLDEVLRLNLPAAEAAGVSLSYPSSDAAGFGVLADPVRLRQVFINLVSNAIKYNRPGGTVRIAVRNEGDQVVAEVTDSGLGMSEEQLQHLYEPFNRLGRERGAIEGTGLGLALTRQLVGLMGGELAFTSELGEGTAARVTLPAAQLPARGAQDERVCEAPDHTPIAHQPQGTVLYIEDNEINVMIIEDMLGRWPGVRFVHAPDGKTGIEQAAHLQPDLVLMDMHLPDMGGLEILKRLRAGGKTARLRVIALSASDAPADVRDATALGAADYWTKPVELAHFLHGVARNLVLAQNSQAG